MQTMSDMESAIPLIYSPRAPRVRMGIIGRFLALAAALVCLWPLVTAAVLKPSASGLGTHTALGLAPCGFQQVTGIPCPMCGMTTSWAWFARGNLPASLWIQPMGTILALLTAVVFWAGLYVAVTGRAVHHLLNYVPSGYIFWSLLALAVLAWLWKIFIQLHHLDGWAN
jgi:Protein of unknown function (DUF2752)